MAHPDDGVWPPPAFVDPPLELRVLDAIGWHDRLDRTQDEVLIRTKRTVVEKVLNECSFDGPNAEEFRDDLIRALGPWF